MKKGRKISGGRYTKSRKKKLFELSGQKRIIKLGKLKRRSKKTRGGSRKTFLLSSDIVNVVSGKKTKTVRISNVIETPSNKFLARQNVITKGTIVETEIGKVKITNRPSHEGILNGILIQ